MVYTFIVNILRRCTFLIIIVYEHNAERYFGASSIYSIQFQINKIHFFSFIILIFVECSKYLLYN